MQSGETPKSKSFIKIGKVSFFVHKNAENSKILENLRFIKQNQTMKWKEYCTKFGKIHKR